MKLKQFIFALVAMLSFGLSAYAQDAVVVNSFAELKAVLEKGNGNAGGAMRITSSGGLANAYGSVSLGANIALEGVIEIPDYRELTLELNGKTISGDDSKYIKNLGSFTILDEVGGGVIACPIYNGTESYDEAYLEIQGGTFKSLAANGAALTNYAESKINAGRFFSEYTALVNYNQMVVDGGAGQNVYIEGKTYSIKNSSTLEVYNAVIAGTADSYLAEDNAATATFDNITYYNVVVNGQGYTSLQEAVDAAASGDLIRLFGNIEESSVVTINKAITLDGNGKKFTTTAANAIKVAATATVNIKDITVEGATDYALSAESSVTVTGSTLSGGGAVSATAGIITLQNTNLVGTAAKDVIYVASNVTVNIEKGSIEAADASGNYYVIAGADGCTGAQLSIMTDIIELGGATNYVNLDTDNNTVKIKSTHEVALNEKGYATEKKGTSLTVKRAVATVISAGNVYKSYTTFAAALDAVQNGETINILNVTGTESGELEFTEDIEFTITGSAPNYALPVVTFQNTTVNIKNAEILTPELDARQEAVINVVNSTVHSAGGNGIVKSYYNGEINIDENSTVYTMQVTTMGYINVKGTLNATWQTNVYGNGMITLAPGSKFATAGLNLIAKEYSGRDNTDTERVGKPATIIVDGATFTVGKVYSESGADYSYNADGYGINVGTIEGKNAVLDIKNGATVNIYTGKDKTANIGANGTVNVAASTLNVACRDAEGTATLANAGTVYVTGASNLAAAKVTGAGWFYMNGVSLDADTKLVGAKVGFINGENTVKGSTIDNGWFSVGIGQNAAADAAAAFAQANGITLGNVTVNVSENAVVGSAGNAYNGWVGSAYSADKTQRTYTLNINNSLAAFGYMHVSKDGTLTVDGRSADNNRYTYDNANVNFYAGDLIVNGVVTFNNADAWVKFTKMSVDHVDGILNINGDTKFESSIHNGGTTSTSLKFWNAGKVNVAKTATVEIDNGTVLVEGAELNIAGNVTAKGAVTGNGAITLTDVAALYTAPADIAVVTNVDNKVVVYENAAYQLKAAVAKINGVCYLTFAEAMAVANATTGEVTVEIIAPVEFVNGMELKGNYTTINFVGKNDEAKMTINQNPGGDYLEAHGKNVNFTDLTLAKANPAWSGNSGHMGNYFSVQGGTATYTNCTFLNGACTSGGTATYTDCTFQNATEYGLWAYDDALVTVNGGTFDSKKGIKVYSEDETTVTTTLTVENATFTENVSAKPAVAVAYAASITLKGNTYNNPTAHIELDSGSDADCEGVTFVAQDANGNDISATLDMTDRSNNNADCGVLVDGKVYTSVTTAVKDAEDGSIVTILYSTDEAVEFVPGVEIKLAEGVTADNVVVADRLKDYVVLPEDVNESNFVFKFGDKTVTDGTNYYATLQAAVEAVAGQPNAVLYCKPGADVGSLQHAPVTSTLTVYGNGANVTGDTERDFDLGNTDPSYGKDITADMTLTVKHLNGCGAWGAKATEHTVNLVFENCANMGKVFITGTTGTLNITMTDCAFEGVIKEAIYSNADGAITLTNVAFSNLNKAVNLNHRAAGTQTVTIDSCTFTDCGADVDADQIPVRVLSSVAGAKSVLTVNNSTFTGTTAGGADILLDYDAIGLTNATIKNTNANVKPENESGNAEMVAVTVNDVYEYCNADVQVGETKYRTFGEAVTAVKNGGTITLLNDITATADYIFVQAPNVQVTIEGNNKTFAGTITVDGKSAAYPTAALTIKDVKFDATGITYDACVRLGDGTTNTRYTNNVTIEGCTFTGEGKVKVGVKNYTGGCKNITITNCTATGMHSLAQLKTSTGVTLAKNTITDCKNAVSLTESTGVNITECIIDVEGYGVRADGGATVVVTDSEIDAFIPVVVRNASSETLLTFNGANTITASNTDDIWCAIGTSEYEENGNLPTAATGKVRVTLNDATLDEEGVYGDFVPVAMVVTEVGTEDYATLEEAFKAATSGCTIEILKDVTIDYAWDNRNTGSKFTVPVTINGNDKIIKFTASVNENNYQAPFRFQADATVKNLTIDMSEVTDNRFRAISSNANLTVDGCKFIGKDATLNCRAIIFGEGAGTNVGNLVISITNSEFINWKRGITDNENAQDVKSVTISGNTLTNAAVGVSAKENVTFTDNTVTGAYVNIESYTAGNKLNVTATGNTLEANTETAYNKIDAGGVVEADEEFIVVAKGRGITGYVGTDRIWSDSWGNARESYVVKVIDANGEVMGTTSLRNINGILDGDVEVTWSINFAGDDTEYWDVKWTTRPSLNNMPKKVQLWIDGALVNEGPVQFNAPDNINKVRVIVTDKDGYIANCHTTLAGALAAAKDGETVTLNWDGSNEPIAMAGTVCGKTVTITGTANVDWSKGWFYIGRNGAADGKVIFDNANLTSVSDSKANGINVSGRKNGSADTFNGTLEIKNSTIVLDYLIQKNVMTLDNSTLTVKNGFSIGGRPASETEDGVDATATITLANNSKVIVNNHNGMGLGYEAIGIMNIDATSTFETTQSFLVTAKGTMNVNGGNVNIAGELTNNGTIKVTGEDAAKLNIAKLTGNAIVLENGNLVDSNIAGGVNAFGTNNISGTTVIGGILSLGYETNPTEQVVVNITGNFNGSNVIVRTNNDVDNLLNVGTLNGERTTAHFGQLAGFADIRINNTDVTYGYAFIRNDLSVNNSTLAINGGVNTYFAGNAKVVIDNSTWNLSGYANIGSYGGYMYGNADVTLQNSSVMTATNMGVERSGESVVNFTIDQTSTFNATKLTNQGTINVAGTVNVNATTVANTGVINFTEETATLTTTTAGLAINENIEDKVVVYVDGTYKFAAAVAEILGTTAEFYTLAEAVEAAEAGATVVLLDNATGAGVVINKNLTIDFAEFTYTFNEGVGSTGTESNGFQILKNNTVTLMNGTLNVAESAKDKFYTIIQNYANLTVKDMNLDGTNLDKWSATDGDSYVLSVNSGNVVIEGETNITANNDGDKAFAFDACTYSSYTAPVVKVYTTGTIKGKIENSATIELYSGTYSYDVTEYCADGYAVVDNHNGTFGVEQTEGIVALTIVHEDYEGEVFENQNVKHIQTLTYTRNLEASGEYLPFCLPFEIPVTALGDDYSVAYFNNVHAYDNDEDGVIEKMTVEVITIKTPNAILRANTPYLIKANSEQARALSIELTDATLEKSVAKVVNMASASVDFTVGGVYSYMSGADVLSGKNDDAKCFYPWAGAWYDYDGDYNEMVFSPFEVYLTMAPKADSPFIISEEAMQSIETRVVGEEFDGTTYIYDVVIENGEEVIYDLQGRRVNDTEKGIYIKGGKKVLVK